MTFFRYPINRQKPENRRGIRYNPLTRCLKQPTCYQEIINISSLLMFGLILFNR